MTEPRWINKHDRLPTKADADPLGCVLVWHIYQRCMVMGWHQVENHIYVTHWKPLPDGPENGD